MKFYQGTNELDKLNISILRVVGNFYPTKGGSVTHVIELSKQIQSIVKSQMIFCPDEGDYQNFDSSFCVPIKRIKSKLLKKPTILKIPCIGIINDFYYSVNIVTGIKNLINQSYLVNVIHVHDFYLGQSLVLLLKIYKIEIPLIIMQHGSPTELGNTTVRASIMRCILLLSINYLKPSYYLQLDDGQVNDHFMKKLNDNKIRNKIVHHAIDTEFYKPNKEINSITKFIILSNNRLDSFKRVDLTILAYEKFLTMIDSTENVLLILNGSGYMSKKLKKIVKDKKLENFVVFHGEKTIEEVKDDLAVADIVVGTSLISNMNRSMQEAMSCGKAIIIFDDKNTNNFFKNMDNSIVVSPGDIEDFACKLKLLYENKELRKQLGKSARKTILKNRSWNFRLSEELEVYRNVLMK